MPVATVANSSISTVTVELRVITVSGKQMTLSVFRQLQSESLVSVMPDGSTFEVNGQLWGFVNYHWAECKEISDHAHVVWSSESGLFRYEASIDHCPWELQQSLWDIRTNGVDQDDSTAMWKALTRSPSGPSRTWIASDREISEKILTARAQQQLPSSSDDERAAFWNQNRSETELKRLIDKRDLDRRAIWMRSLNDYWRKWLKSELLKDQLFIAV